jgi:hypothetical protein
MELSVFCCLDLGNFANFLNLTPLSILRFKADNLGIYFPLFKKFN